MMMMMDQYDTFKVGFSDAAAAADVDDDVDDETFQDLQGGF